MLMTDHNDDKNDDGNDNDDAEDNDDCDDDDNDVDDNDEGDDDHYHCWLRVYRQLGQTSCSAERP